MPEAAAPPAQTTPAEAPSGLSRIPIDKGQPSAEAQRLQALEKSFKDHGFDLGTFNPGEARKSFEVNKKLAGFDLAAVVRAEATKMAEEMVREKLKGKQPRRGAQAVVDEDEELEEEDDPFAKQEKRLAQLEKQLQDRDKSENDQAKQAKLERQWGTEYAELERTYPILAQDPDIGHAMQLVGLGVILAAQNDPKQAALVEQPGFVKQIGPTILSALLRAGRKLAAAVPEDIQGGDATPPEKFDYANATDAQFRQHLAAGLRRRRR